MTTTTPVRTQSPSTRAASPARRMPRAGISLVAIAILIGLWWLAAVAIDDPVVLPSPPEVAMRAVELLGTGSGNMWPDIGASLARVLIGWSLGIVAGVVLGVALASSKTLYSAIDPIMQGARSIPPLAWTPLLIVWLGIGELSKVFLIFVATLPIIAIGTAAGISGVDLSLRRAALTLGASPAYLLRRVILPGSLPELLTAMRISQGLSWSCLVAAELIASTEGIGYRIMQAGRYLDTSTIFVGILLIGVLASATDAILQVLQRRLVPWKGKA
ncbi:ABC transporter permease [Agromyces aerolatus]|uniref:ABC transporter permease n=1 Tax=Agromyces sp. LY-1074 TaxID=3074080 RepID=UPI00285E8232|nr:MULTISPECIES: ABC transporter permease [unclassified Agromyces]MDR5701666.1 ABC transporter permease [Agromyces sp. LY-1074]MDR5707894.1 ABC transporter permease [Agromyces sp. LY-1358]